MIDLREMVGAIVLLLFVLGGACRSPIVHIQTFRAMLWNGIVRLDARFPIECI